MDKQYYVYILASKKNGTLYVGITNDLIKSVYQHKEKLVEGFTKKYDVDKLVYFEVFRDPENAIKREKRIKFYKRKWKINLIEKSNPGWKDLYRDLMHGSCEQVRLRKATPRLVAG
jgi:putative endonuclease